MCMSLSSGTDSRSALRSCACQWPTAGLEGILGWHSSIAYLYWLQSTACEAFRQWIAGVRHVAILSMTKDNKDPVMPQAFVCLTSFVGGGGLDWF